MRALNSSARPLSFGLLALLLCSTALGEQQAFITVDPNSFAPGQNISNATTGAALVVMTAVPNPDPNAPPEQAFVPQYSPSVYAQPVAAGCFFKPQVPCAPLGNLMLGYSGGTIPVQLPDLWASADAATECLGGCFVDVGFRITHVLRVNFTVPTDHVSAVALQFSSEGSAIWAFSFNSAGQLVGVCSTSIGAFISPCLTRLTPGTGEGWFRMTITRSVPDISFVVIGGEDIGQPIAQIQFDSPVSLQLAGLLAKVNGVGPGRSLVDTMMQAQADYAAGDIATTCALLAGFVDEVKAQNGKHIDTLTDAQLLSTAIAIEAGFSCN